MGRDMFFERVEDELGFESPDWLLWAYSLAKYFHRPQTRDNGQRYFEHCREVSLILLDLGPTTSEELAVALLHDIYEDQFVPAGMIEKLFGWEIDDALRVLSKEKMTYRKRGLIEKRKVDLENYFRQIISDTLLIRRVKLADRLHNLRSIDVQPKERKLKKVRETRKYILPIAATTVERSYGLIVDKATTSENNQPA